MVAGVVQGHWLEPVVHLAGSLGLRREEICGLRWDSVDFQLRKIHIRAAFDTHKLWFRPDLG